MPNPKESAPEPAPMPGLAAGIAAVRGAITVPANEAGAILEATSRLLLTLCETNGVTPERIVSALFTATHDLDADYPAHAARRLGWNDVPLLGAREISVPGALPRVVRVLLTVAGVPPGARLVPAYLDDAAALRPDLAPPPVGSVPGDSPAAAPSGASAGGRGHTPARRIAIVGLGQIGGSIGLSLARTGGWHRIGVDPDASTRVAALAAGAIDEAAASIAAACAGAALAVIAAPADVVPALLDEAAASLPRGAALADTCSARAQATPALARAAARGLQAAGVHPLAGTEGHGFGAARAGLFDGATIAVSPARGEVPGIVGALVRDLGGREVRVAPEAHDQALARTSHLPYVIACGLLGLGAGAAAAGLSGPGFRDMTRLAASDERMALGYCRANAAEVRAAWGELKAALEARIANLEA